jgi:hypothetical protein
MESKVAMAEQVMKCVVCSKDFSLDVPQFQIINEKLVSMLVFAHEQQPLCPHCGTPYRFELIGLKGAVFGFKKVEERVEGPKIISPPMDLDFSKLKGTH